MDPAGVFEKIDGPALAIAFFFILILSAAVLALWKAYIEEIKSSRALQAKSIEAHTKQELTNQRILDMLQQRSQPQPTTRQYYDDQPARRRRRESRVEQRQESRRNGADQEDGSYEDDYIEGDTNPRDSS